MGSANATMNRLRKLPGDNKLQGMRVMVYNLSKPSAVFRAFFYSKVRQTICTKARTGTKRITHQILL